jgi:hypothetical protein
MEVKTGIGPVPSTVKNRGTSQAVVAHAFNPSIWEAKAGRFLPGLQSEFKDSQGYTEKPCLEKPKKKKKKKKNREKNTYMFLAQGMRLPALRLNLPVSAAHGPHPNCLNIMALNRAEGERKYLRILLPGSSFCI